MSVQYNAVSAIPPLHIVLYCLTPPESRRYSSLTLCLPYPARGEENTGGDVASIVVRNGRNRSGKQGRMRISRAEKCAKMVTRQKSPTVQMATDSPLVPRSSRCSN